MNLRGQSVRLGIVTVGGQTTGIDSCLYNLKVVDKNGIDVEVEAYGIENISSPIESLNMNEIAKLFSIPSKEITRPQSGEIDVLIGMQYASLHPVRVNSFENLLLMKNRFGQVVAGAYPGIKRDADISPSCMQVRTALVMHVGKLETFFETEGLGVMCEPRCGGCKCGKCQVGGKNMTMKEEHEYKLIEEGLSFDEAKGRWIASYPWIRPPEELPNNRSIAMATLRSTERRLSKNESLATLYSQQIHDMEARNAAREISHQELTDYTGPKYYISHHAVFKPSSKSTPCRIVFNSSARHHGHSLNEYLAKGPSLLNHLLGVLMRFREGKYAFIGDISKMFHSIDIPLRDQMTHLYLWRDCDFERDPQTYAMTAVNMGDRPSATIAQIALRKTAEEVAEEYPKASMIIQEDSYMDDILSSSNSKSESVKLQADIEAILSSKGFHIKEWICSSGTSQTITSNTNACASEEVSKELMKTTEVESEEKVLGIRWKPEEDVLKFVFSAPCTTESITKRKVLSIANKIYDPLGLLAPFTVRLKIIMRRIWASDPKIGWDDNLTPKLMEDWNEIIKEINAITSIDFKRSLTPTDAEGEPMLVIFSDGSEQAYGAVAYMRWKTKAGYKSTLIAAKTRMAPLKVVDIVKLELCGAVLGKRLRETIQNEIRQQFSKVCHMVDSEIVQAMVRKQSYGFNTFTANRVGEIQAATSPTDWYWVAGKPWLNVADMTTRGCTPGEMGEDSIWQNGPSFLALPEDQWPVRQDSYKDTEIPEDVLKRKLVGVSSTARKTVASSDTLTSRFDLNRVTKWRLLVHSTARVMKLYTRFRSGSTCRSLEPTADDLERAELRWILEAQREMDITTCQKLRPVIEDGILVVGGRAERWMEATWNRQKFILLPKNHAVSQMIERHEHEKGGHLGVEATIAKIRAKYWIVGLRRSVRKMIARCVKCIKKLKEMCSQVMSPLPVERLRPSPPFANIGVDYFGPFAIKGEVQKRVRGKCYGIIVTCFSSRAVYIDIARDYSTEGFLEVFRRFGCMRGWPNKVLSDNAKMLVSASNELKGAIANLNWEEIMAFGAQQGIDWSFPPADAPWYNGATEALVKTTKRALVAAIGENVLTFSEFQTALFEAGQIVNQRPIGRLPATPDEGTYLCPNDLLLGRSTPTIPQGPFSERCGSKQRLDFIQSIVNTFWKRWTREVFPNLVIQPKWHTEKRNLQKGDIVLVQDSNAVRGEWRMALVEEGKLSEDGHVRRVTVSYRSVTGIRQMIERPVQRLILLVPIDEEH